MEYTRRYLMDGLHNLRDLGGYAVPGGITRFGVLLRSDLPWHLTEDDGKRFAALEVRHTLDLRDVDESESMPDELALLRGVTYRQIAMKKVPRAVARNRPGGLSAFDEAFFWGDEYIRMLEDNHPWAKECAEFLAAAEGTVLFHCFTGKDRTGIFSALGDSKTPFVFLACSSVANIRGPARPRSKSKLPNESRTQYPRWTESGTSPVYRLKTKREFSWNSIWEPMSISPPPTSGKR